MSTTTSTSSRTPTHDQQQRLSSWDWVYAASAPGIAVLALPVVAEARVLQVELALDPAAGGIADGTLRLVGGVDLRDELPHLDGGTLEAQGLGQVTLPVATGGEAALQGCRG